MSVRSRAHVLLSIVLLVSVLVVVAFWVGLASAGNWLQNPGFEEGLNYWTVSQPAAGTVVAVGPEGPSQFPEYGTMGVGIVSPPGGQKMLRLGLPKVTNTNQIKGVESVKQTFDPQSRQIDLVYRLLTWEHRSGDTFVIDVKDTSGNSVGKWASGSSPPYSTPLSLPYKAPILIAKSAKYWDSNWQDIHITGLPSGPLTISYTLSNSTNAAHDTWVYVDRRNSAPTAGSVTISPKPAYTRSLLTASPSGFSDPDGDSLTYHYAWTKGGAPVGSDSPTLDLSVAGNGDIGDTIAVSVTAFDGAATSTAASDSLTVSGASPVADFAWAPGGPGGEYPHEGDVIGLYGDPSSDPDGGEIVEWEWRIHKEGQTDEVYNQDNDYQSPVGFIVPYSEGAYGVTLTISDDDGLQDSVTKQIDVQNYIPRVNALNIEVLPGGTAQLVGRFLDPGWMDDHTATWTPSGGGTITGQVQEDHLATVSSGYVGGTFTADEAISQTEWTLAVDDGGVSGTDAFEVSVVSPDPNRLETGGAFPNVPSLDGNGAYLSYLQSKGDIDIFEVKTADGSLLPTGTEVLVTLRDQPADYDLAVFEGVTGTSAGAEAQAAPFLRSPFSTAPLTQSPFFHSPFESAPFFHSPFFHSPYESAPFFHSPFFHSPFMPSPLLDSAYVNAPFFHSPFFHSPFFHSPIPALWGNLDGYPLSQMSFTGAEDDNTSGIDISFDELGFDHEAMENLRVLGFSANTGTESEVVLATAGYPQTGAVKGHVYVAIKSAAGDFSAAAPYTLQIETSRPFDVLALGQEDQQPLVTNPGSWGPLPDPANPLTLFVTQFDRLKSLYPAGTTLGDPRDGGQIVRGALMAVAGRADVEGKIISLPAADYTQWDVRPWLVDEANKLAQSIRSEIQAQLTANPSIKYVVLVGDDRVVPFRRLIDQTLTGNEQSYTEQSFLVPPSATLSSIANGYILTDDFYVDETPIGWNGSYLYIPDLAVSRLVEKPAEIAGTIQAFIDADGVLARDAAVVSGHSFMADGAQAVRDTLTAAGMTMLGAGGSLLSDTWRGSDLWTALDSGPDLTSLNSHFTHFAGLSAFGYGQSVVAQPYGESELLLSADVAAAGGGTLFKGKLVFSMGCHAGLSVPDEQAAELSPDDPIVPALDLPQAMMRQGGIYLGSTGYGYGDTVGTAGTEALIGFFAEKLVGEAGSSTSTPAGSIGLALAQAKHDYLGSLSTLTPYEQKSSVQFTLYGMPHYRLPTTVSSANAVSGAPVRLAAASLNGVPLDPFRLKLGERSMQTTWTASTVEQSYEMLLETGSTGQYITADGRSEAIPDRPIHPIVAVDLPARPAQGPAHGFIYKEGSYTELTPFEPAISRLTTEWEVGAAEFQVATREYWPVEPGALTTIETPVGYEQTFVAVPAQFNPTVTTPAVRGSERVWSYLKAEVLRSTAPSGGPEDWLPPSVRDVDLWMDVGRLIVSVDAHDASGISRMVVLQMGAIGMYTPAGGDHDFGNPGTPNGEGGRYEASLDLAGQDPAAISLFIQVVDGRGNVTTLTGRGATVRLRSGLRNAGFEEGLKYWSLTQPAPGNGVVIEGLDDAPILGALGITVSPFSGAKMLRLGVPRDKDAHQVKGVTSASQQFISDGGAIVLAYRVVSLDSRLFDDVFTIDVKDASGTVVYSFAVPNLPGDPYGDTGWAEATITGLTAGTAYTLTYSLDNTRSASHNTWVYVDQGS